MHAGPHRGIDPAGAPVGEPALGPVAFMHRRSAAEIPIAPLSHHTLDSTHIAMGVISAGVDSGPWMIETSVFNGREPDENRWDFDPARLDSWAARFSFNPTLQTSLQLSRGYLKSPEATEPGTDILRSTVSLMYHTSYRAFMQETTIAWGQNDTGPGQPRDGFLVEAALRFTAAHTLFARGERVQKDGLFPDGDPRHGTVYTVNKVSLGYEYTARTAAPVSVGAGILGSVSLVDGLKQVYNEAPLSITVFLQAKIM
jgi:hypothetical protein